MQLELLPERDQSTQQLFAVLYTNRAAAQYYLGNRRSAMLDSTNALKHKPDHFKALHRLCLCFYEKVSTWKKNSAEKLKLKKRNERKEQLKQQKIQKVQSAIQARGVKVKAKWPDESFAAVPPLVESSDLLSWPVTFFYPEYLECDFIQSVDETSSFHDHLSMMFETAAPWDENNSHTIDNLSIYYEDVTETPRQPVLIKDSSMTLKETLKLQKVVEDHHLRYFVLPKNNP